MNIPSAAELRTKLEHAKERKLKPVYDAAEKMIDDFAVHIVNLVGEPGNYTHHTSFVKEIPAAAYHNASANIFIDYIQNKLMPLGYVVEKSHDGGGLYSTVVIRWNIVKSRMTTDLHRHEHGAG